MFCRDETIAYGATGICKIEDIRYEKFTQLVDDEAKLYYVLRPVFGSPSTLYVPANNEKLTHKMRHVLTKKEIDALLMSVKDNKIEWIEDTRQRTEEYNKILFSGIRTELLLLIRCLYMKKIELTQKGRKFYATDEKVLTAAEKIVSEEFSYALGITQDEVSAYIIEKLGDKVPA